MVDLAEQTISLPQAFGPFVIDRLIGMGGMGLVYRATHAATGQRVAIKTVRVPRAEFLSSIRREIHTLRRLRHPGVVRIVDAGIADGEPWYAMDLLDGPTVRDHLDGAWHARGSPPRPTEFSSGAVPPAAQGELVRALTIVRRLCAALGYLHGEGIVHGDVKPENIVLEPADQPVLVDFGVMWHVPGLHGREVLDDLVGATGTPAYMAPEQFWGDAVDARADLFAVGCVLYELLTGQCAFPGRSDAGSIARNLSSRPKAVSLLVADVPSRLSALVTALLEADPRHRFGHADDVIAELDALGAQHDASPQPRHTLTFLYRPRLSGRDRVLAELLDAAHRAASGEGDCILIGGESGIGKTYLATEVARRCGPELRVAIGHCIPVGTGQARHAAPLQPLAGMFQSIADHCTEGGEPIADRVVGAHGRTLAAHAPALASLPGRHKYPPPAALEGPAAREELFASCAGVLAAFARESPLLWIIDDLQWADELTLGLLRALPPTWFRERPLLLLATYRTDEVTPELTELTERSDARHLALGGVDAPSVHELILDMLALKEVPSQFCDFLLRQSQGNPFHIAEYLRTGIAEGVLRRTPGRMLELSADPSTSSDTTGWALPLPNSLRDLVLRRLRGLDVAARGLIDIGAVLGREFDSEVLRSAAQLDVDSMMDATAELLRRQVLEQIGTGGFRFVHDKLAEVAYSSISPARRCVLHAAAATALTAVGGGSLQPGYHAQLAHHWALAGEPKNELPHRAAAGSEALSAAAFADAAEHLRQALALADHGTPLASGPVSSAIRAQWQFGAAQAEHGRGDVPAAESHAVAVLGQLGYRWPSSTAGWLTMLARQIPIQIVYRLRPPRLQLLEQDTRDGLRAAARSAELLTHRYFYIENTPAMLASAFVAANLAERAAATADVPKAFIAIAFMAKLLRRRTLAARAFAIAERGVEEVSDPARRADGFASLSVYHATFGDWRRAEAAVERALECLDEVRDAFAREIVITTAGHVEYFTGRFAAAQARYAEVLESARARGNIQHVPWGLFAMARSLVALGRFGDAVPLLVEARAELAQRPELQSEITCSGLLALSLLRLGDRTVARQRADEALALIRRAQPTGFPTVEGYTAVVDVYCELLAEEPARTRRATAQCWRVSLRALRRFAGIIPMAKPMWLLRAARFAQSRGKRRRAQRLLQRALTLAEGYSMLREQAAAHRALGDLAPLGSSARAAHWREARQQFAAIGCEHELRSLDQHAAGEGRSD